MRAAVHLPLVAALLGGLVPLVGISHAQSDPLTCQRAVLKETTKFFKGKVKALQQCEEARTKGKHTDPCPCPGCSAGTVGKKTQDKVERVTAKLRAGIDKSCGGANKVCEPLGDDNLNYAGLFGINQCPNFESGACTQPIVANSCEGLRECLLCIGEAVVDQLVPFLYTDFDPVRFGATNTLDRAINKCQIAIGKETTAFALTKERTLGTCWDARYKGKHNADCPDITADLLANRDAFLAALKIARAESKKITKLCKVCGGADKACDDTVQAVNPNVSSDSSGGNDDLLLADIFAVVPDCPRVVAPAKPDRGAVDCAQKNPMTTLADLVFCVDCVAEFKVDCLDAARVTNTFGVFAQVPSECNPPTPMPTTTVPATATPTPQVTPAPGLRCPSGQAGCGPLLQNPLNDPTTMTILWWTDLTAAEDDEVRYGTAWDDLTGSETQTAPGTCDIGTNGKCHRVDLTGLTPNTDYFYELRSNGAVVQAAEAGLSFHTLLPAGSTEPLTFAVIGDFGSGLAATTRVRDLMATHPAQMIVTVGDNAYTNGTLAEWENNVLKVFVEPFKRMLFFPTVGNHDIGNSYSTTAWPTAPQKRIFTAPITGTCRANGSNPGDACLANSDCTGGGTCNVPGRAEEFYSFDSGDAHFVVLTNSFGSEQGSTNWSNGVNEQQWLLDDLAASQKPWKFAFHHNSAYSCPYNAGHGSNLANRAKLSPIFEWHGVTLAFTGHDHIWNRSIRVDDYQDLAGTGGSDGKGTYYVVQGTGGRSLYPSRCHATGGTCVGRNLGGPDTTDCGVWMAQGCNFPSPIPDTGAEGWCSFGASGAEEYSFTLVTLAAGVLTLKTYASYQSSGDHLIDNWTMPTPP